MEMMQLGRTGLTISRTGFGCLPIQRLDFDAAGQLLHRAVEGGITFFDTARGYSDSEAKIGRALAGVRRRIVLATKVHDGSRDQFREDFEKSLTELRTDYVDLLQLHNPKQVPDPDAPDSAFAAALEAKEQGMCRAVGVTNHRLDVARRAVESGLFDTLQFPLSAVSSSEDLELIDLCRERDVGVIAMKAMCGGLLTDIPAAFAFLRQYDNLVPIWGIQRESELDEFLALEANPPAMDDAMRAAIERDRAELAGDFCRGCGYCTPCPEGIPINTAARMKYLLRRAPSERFLSGEWQEKMARIENCRECGQCAERCPYDLSPPDILRKMLDDYNEFVAQSA